MKLRRQLYAERARLKAQADSAQAGTVQWTEQLSARASSKLVLAWKDAVANLSASDHNDLIDKIMYETHRSIGYELPPDAMSPELREVDNNDRLSLIEAEHAALKDLAESIAFDFAGFHAGSSLDLDAFTDTVNEILESNMVSLRLDTNSVLVPTQSHEMHREVVEPVLSLLHGGGRFDRAEKAYQKALSELRNRDPGDAITDAATALSEMFTALGCRGPALGDQLATAKKTGLIRGTDAPLTESISRWVATQRNNGEAHHAVHEYGMSDAWMVVHVVGALMIRLSEFDAQRDGQA